MKPMRMYVPKTLYCAYGAGALMREARTHAYPGQRIIVIPEPGTLPAPWKRPR